MSDSLHQYVTERKHGKNLKKGVLFGNKNPDGTICIGFSSCSPRDEFDRYFGLEVAVSRAFKYCLRAPKQIPYSIKDSLFEFVIRCNKYFKPLSFPVWVNDFLLIKFNEIDKLYDEN